MMLPAARPAPLPRIRCHTHDLRLMLEGHRTSRYDLNFANLRFWIARAFAANDLPRRAFEETRSRFSHRSTLTEYSYVHAPVHPNAVSVDLVLRCGQAQVQGQERRANPP